MSWGAFFGGIGKLLEKGATYIPGRMEKLKNERETLLAERAKLQQGAWNAKKGARVEVIDARLLVLERWLLNKTQD